MCHDNLLIFLPIFSPQDKNSLSILSCHFLPIKKIGKKLLNIFRNLFLQYISCTVIWILNFKNCSKLIAKCWRHVRSIYYPKPRSKNHPWINVQWYGQLMFYRHHYDYYHYHYNLYRCCFHNHHCSYHCYHDHHKINIIFIIVINIIAIIITIIIIMITINNMITVIWKSVFSWWDKSKMVKLVCWI